MEKKICLNFFGEKVEIIIPNTIESLRKSISEKFSFTPSEVGEIAMYYIKDLSKKAIKTEEDLKQFLKEKFNELILEIDEESQIYKKKEEEILQAEKIAQLKEQIKLAKEEHTKKINQIKEEKVKMKTEMLELKSKIIAKKQEQIKENQDYKEKILNIVKEIKSIQKKKPSPIKEKVQKTNEPKKTETKIHPLHDYKANLERVKKEEGNVSKPVHPNISCDGCGKFPIVGIRYKCAICKNFDFCEDCEEMNVNAHQHPFIKITDPKFSPSVIKCIIKDTMPNYEKQ